MHLRKRKPEQGMILHMPRASRHSRLYWFSLAMEVCGFALLLLLLFVVRSAHSQRRNDGYVTYQQFRDRNTDQNRRLDQIDGTGGRLDRMEAHIENDDKIIAGWQGQLTLIEWLVGGGTLPLGAASVGLRLVEKKRNGR